MHSPSNDTIAAATRALEKAKTNIVLDHPFFASLLLKRPITLDENIPVPPGCTPTLAVDGHGHITAAPSFIAGLTGRQVIWALCHEVLHYASGHPTRRGTRNAQVWNYAGDMWINDTLDACGIGEKIPGCIDVGGSKDRTVEDIYAELMDQMPPDDEFERPMSGDVQPGDSTDSDTEAVRKLEVAEAAQIAKARGQLPGVLKKFASDTIDTKVPWYSVLERFMTGAGNPTYSWQRPNRRYTDCYLPSMANSFATGEIVLQIDVSGSISIKELRHYEGHIKAIVAQCAPRLVHVIYTDTSVVHHDRFENPEDIQLTHRSGGGTCMEAGFDYLLDQGIDPEVVVTLTDAYDSYTKAPPWPCVWCVSTDRRPPYGDIVPFKIETN